MTKEVLAIDALESRDEIERSKRARAFYQAQLERLEPVSYSLRPSLLRANQTTLKQSHKASLSRASDLRPTLPKLSPSRPPQALGMEISRAIQRNERVLNDIAQVLIRNIRSQNDELVRLSKEDEEHLNKLLEQLAKNENSDTVKSLLNIVTSSTAITIGALLLAPETAAAITATAAGAALYASVSSVWSYLLIASGVSNILTNEVLPRIGGFEKIASFLASDDQSRKDLAENIQVTTSLANTVMGVVASVATSPLIGAVLEWSHGLKLLNTGLEVATGGANFIGGINQREANLLQANKTDIDGKLTRGQSQLDQAHLELYSATDLAQAFNKTCYNVFQTLKKINENNTK